MPKMNGLELIEKVREIDPVIAILMISAYGSIETAVKIIISGLRNGRFCMNFPH